MKLHKFIRIKSLYDEKTRREGISRSSGKGYRISIFSQIFLLAISSDPLELGTTFRMHITVTLLLLTASTRAWIAGASWQPVGSPVSQPGVVAVSLDLDDEQVTVFII